MILNEISVRDGLVTSGQPTATQLEEIRARGYTTIIDLSTPDSRNVLAAEADIAGRLGLTYIRIPVIWEAPRLEQFEQFARLLQVLEHERVWVHCALNMRASCFMFLYRLLILQEDENTAFNLVTAVWQPNNCWTRFMHEVVRKYRGIEEPPVRFTLARRLLGVRF
ncbi:protein tyrosine phosphatase family protein [Parathalassolituus penaei]|uniref:Protein tyrosine phosphatase family protein n=1 Tax=Parathalassolituus penaei TaxID=2997323 RepID=A0A9X3ISS1_9GAMM|nr:protein tyrosine phosphatase family protein [Parathalassolituus penaei]MCY0966712.1 protein tyrosine phosphatase family protein [Parathalassolituus penaei]